MTRTLAEECEFWKAMDKEYSTPVASPLHHDNRCKKCLKGSK